uniref:Uncharacterized protein TCIL3000_10_13420 n=1 Tax=Trypanosoma congolense (strain IL3000) TaxID=1068625 RepID=G0UYU2_TRYCI|nr:unnamed protein product [Trypanosoma congolense IL3000]
MIQCMHLLLSARTPVLLRQAAVAVNHPSATLRQSFYTEGIAAVLQRELPPTASLVTIDNRTKGKHANLASIVRLMDSFCKAVMESKEGSHQIPPVLLIVQTKLKREDADVDQFVLTKVLNERKGLKNTTAVVLDAEQTVLINPMLREQKGYKMVVKEDNAIEILGLTLITSDASSRSGKGTSPEEAKKTRAVVKSENKGDKAVKIEAAKGAVESKPRETHAEGKSKKESANADYEKGADKPSAAKPQDNQRRLPPAQSEDRTSSPKNSVNVKEEGKSQASSKTTLETSAIVDREALDKVFHSTLSVPFQPPPQVERELFSGYVDTGRLADILNLPLYGSSSVFTLYYRLTGAGACRTPLITITQTLRETCRKGAESAPQHLVLGTANRIPVLLLLSAPFLIGEDARLLCEEYQKSLQKQFSTAADITVIVAPACYTEKNVLYALSTAQEGSREEPPGKRRPNDPPQALNHTPSPGEPASTSLSETVLREIVSTTMEEVALRHEKSTLDLSSAVKQLLKSFPPDRIANVVNEPQGESHPLLDATKGLDEIQQQIRGTKEVLDKVQKDVTTMVKHVKTSDHSEEGAVPTIRINELHKVLEALKDKVVEFNNATPTTQQLSSEMREVLFDVSNSLRETLSQSLQQGFRNMQDQQESQLSVALKEYTLNSTKERALTEQTLRDLPQNIQNAMEKALLTLTWRTDENTARVLEDQQKLVDAKVSAMCETLSETVERGNERLRDTLTNLLQRTPDDNATTVAPANAPLD